MLAMRADAYKTAWRKAPSFRLRFRLLQPWKLMNELQNSLLGEGMIYLHKALKSIQIWDLKQAHELKFCNIKCIIISHDEACNWASTFENNYNFYKDWASTIWTGSARKSLKIFRKQRPKRKEKYGRSFLIDWRILGKWRMICILGLFQKR